ncbi:hypothetical protein [Prevotella sp. P5-108]|uniref:hypothetical protein n=1 Tax=Prevotella sp. P5-108 TaxID=2024225 RepID=UPI00117E94CA|nr:hypothetical protein [Prevotella sp. P5-108]
MTAAKVGVVSSASVFISLVTDIISLISDVIFPVVNVIPSASDVIFSVVNFIPSASDVISPVMPLKMISGFETVISRLDIIVADTEITISCLAIVLKGLSPNLRMVGVGTNKNSLPLGLASCAVLTPGERVTYFTNNAMSLSVATAE